MPNSKSHLVRRGITTQPQTTEEIADAAGVSHTAAYKHLTRMADGGRVIKVYDTETRDATRWYLPD